MKDSVTETIVIGKSEFEALLQFAAAAIRADVAIPCYNAGECDCDRCKVEAILDREGVK